jgi:hypothetical protein
MTTPTDALTIPCDCGYEVIRLDLKFAHDEDGFVALTVLTPHGDQWTRRERFKAIWRMLRGKTYTFSEVLIRPEEYNRFHLLLGDQLLPEVTDE